MSTTPQERLQAARADLLNAEAVIVQEHLQGLHDRLKAVTEEGRAIDKRIAETGARLVDARRSAEPLWAMRDLVSKTRVELDAVFEKNDFPSEEEIEQYETKRSELTGEWHQLTQQITVLSNIIGPAEEELRQLNFARSQAATAAGDLRLALSEARRPQRF